ncbi:MAG: PilZ domain-containing protein [Gammaproteobacteria bacterium]|nr:PilZ domain-containing protein [Gammaproteobacteria bacterium]
MSSEQRRHLRIGVEVDIEMTVPGQPPVDVHTRNISDGGLFIVLDNTSMPKLGTQVMVKLKHTLGDGEEPPTNLASVVRHDPDGIGLKFIDDNE